MDFSPKKVYILGMVRALAEEFINPNTVTLKPLSSDKIVHEDLWNGISLTYEARKDRHCREHLYRKPRRRCDTDTDYIQRRGNHPEKRRPYHLPSFPHSIVG